ncbi:diaminopropionate ammonia-lyase [Plantactinospora sp. BB1]|nr:diaminopropionate ammonia-lyase [Plantactinospora sp. BB1]
MPTRPTGPAPRFVANPSAGGLPERPSRAVYDWHRALPGYAATPLRELPDLAGQLGLERLWVKDETDRFGLPAFKILGASWASEVALAQLAARPAVPVLVAATDGNHGRAVARVARRAGCRARIFLPADTAPARIEAIRAEGAEIDARERSYDDAVRAAADFADASADAVLVSDTAFHPADPVPRATIDGYGTIFWEIGDVFARTGDPWPDLVTVQIGVGGLAAATARFLRHHAPGRPFICGVEPVDAGCAAASVGRDTPAQIESDFRSVMVGLNAGRLSSAAWPDLATALDGFLTVADEWALLARDALRERGIPAGDTGAAGLAGLLALRQLAAERDDPALAGARTARRALVVVTEGRTDDPDAVPRR